jgi:SiaC family regulatory phosphoprotein
MRELYPGTKTIPRIAYNENSNEIFIEGWSLSERPHGIYAEVNDLIDKIYSKSKEQVSVHINLYCFNTSSSKCLMELSRQVCLPDEAGTARGSIHWHYDPQDPETMEWGEDIAISAGVKFNYLPLPSAN